MGDKDIIESQRFNTQVIARVVFMFSKSKYKEEEHYKLRESPALMARVVFMSSRLRMTRKKRNTTN